MKVQTRIAILVLAVGLAVGLWLVPTRNAEPTYEGEKLSVWTERAIQYADDAPGIVEHVPSETVRNRIDHAVIAVRAIGPKGLPLLLEWAGEKETVLSKFLENIPVRLRIIFFHPGNIGSYHDMAESGFRCLGQDAAPAVPALVQLLKDRDGSVRGTAFHCLAYVRSGAVGALPTLIEMLGDKRPDVQLQAAGCLGAMGPVAAPAVPSLTALLNNANEYVRKCAVYSIGRIGPQAGSAVPSLIEAVTRTNAPIQFSGFAIAIGRIGPNAKFAAPYLETIMNNRSNCCSVAAEVALIQIGELPVRTFFENLQNYSDTNWPNRASYATRIFRTNSEAALPYLLEALTQTNLEIQLAALSAIDSIRQRPDLCVPSIVLYIKSSVSTNQMVRGETLRSVALTVLGNFGEQAKSALPTVLESLQDEHDGVRNEAYYALRRISPEAAANAGLK